MMPGTLFRSVTSHDLIGLTVAWFPVGDKMTEVAFGLLPSSDTVY